jgi:hypothetical protein
MQNPIMYVISTQNLVQPNISKLFGFNFFFEWVGSIICKISEVGLDTIMDTNPIHEHL